MRDHSKRKHQHGRTRIAIVSSLRLPRIIYTRTNSKHTQTTFQALFLFLGASLGAMNMFTIADMVPFAVYDRQNGHAHI